MTDYSRQLAYIAKTEDAKELRQLVDRARALGAKPVEEAAFRKMVTLGIDHEAGSVEHDFWVTVNAFEADLKQERGKTVRLGRTRQKVARDGVVKTLADWAIKPPTDGFHMLLERDLPELLGEAIVMRHADRFEPDVVEAARARLIDAGVDMERVMRG
ncbi:hypothetical protein [Brevundimonas sp.]|jgi:hypothetical protein|uniref:hypothetical protein n=1 Tax=Brevundimonas sp. TaxID=1871086 RepID=UPI002E12A4A7|nr:hypothetical protein [Brevundimonas sp.]